MRKSVAAGLTSVVLAFCAMAAAPAQAADQKAARRQVVEKAQAAAANDDCVTSNFVSAISSSAGHIVVTDAGAQYLSYARAKFTRSMDLGAVALFDASGEYADAAGMYGPSAGWNTFSDFEGWYPSDVTMGVWTVGPTVGQSGSTYYCDYTVKRIKVKYGTQLVVSHWHRYGSYMKADGIARSYSATGDDEGNWVRSNRVILLQRQTKKGWVTVRTVHTNSRGAWAVKAKYPQGNWRAVTGETPSTWNATSRTWYR